MGFSENAGKRAALATKNAGAEAAVNWVLQHMSDSDINDPIPESAPAQSGGGGGGVQVDQAQAASLASMMGFSTEFASLALKANGNNMERAAAWLFENNSKQEQLLAEAKAKSAPKAPSKPQFTDGDSTYELFGIVSHMGGNTACGHYVAHVKKDGQWIIFNDSKVAKSESPPYGAGYMYFFRRSVTATS